MEPQTVTDRLLDDEVYTDITFIVGAEGKRISAHRYILNRNPVWKDLLEQDLQEIVLQDVEPAAFKRFLRYTYDQKKDIDFETAFGQINVAERFGAQELVEKIKAFLLSNLTEQNVLDFLDKSIEIGMTDISTECLKFIFKSSSRTEKVFKTQNFLHCSPRSLRTIIKDDTLPLEEIKIFRYVMQWAKYNCVKQRQNAENAAVVRAMLGDIIVHVRFTQMSMNTFWRMVVPTEILSEEETTRLSEYIVGSSTDCSGFDIGERKNIGMICRLLSRIKEVFRIRTREHPIFRVVWNSQSTTIV